MGHHINAVIGSSKALASLADRLGSPDPVELPFDLVIIPLDEQRLDAIAMSVEPAFDGFTYLTPTMAREIGSAISNGPALYIETEYFGGMGSQSAALFENGVLTWKDAESTIETVAARSFLTRFFRPSAAASKSPISAGLAKLGIVGSEGQDEFDRIGLGRFRSLEDLGLHYED
jgi:hypothetical protein